ncbi:uncharacterized protein [Oscarella lobularis]|uniref:uncharacterized protein n=1 Tax=Oscarella lobularis TaxID=121494 RepID=UPI003313F1E5
MFENVIRTRHEFLRLLLVLQLVVRVEGDSQAAATLNSSRAVKIGDYVELTCQVPVGQKFDPANVVYRFNEKAIDDSKFDEIKTVGSGEQKLKIFQADLSHNGTYTCQPKGFKESNKAIIYILTDDPTIHIRGPLNRDIYEGSRLYLETAVFYQAGSLTLSVVHEESDQGIPGSIQRLGVFTNRTVCWNLTMSRSDEGRYYVKGVGNLRSTNAKFRSNESVEIAIIRKPNSVQISENVVKKDSAELYWNLVPPDPSYKNDLVMYYEVQWKGNTGHVFEPNVTINGLGVCEDFPVSIIAVGNGTESDETLTRIRTGLDPDRPVGFFRDPERDVVYASVGDKELPVCVYRDSYLCHPAANSEMRRRRTNTHGDYYYLFNFNETESHRRKEPVPIQCPVVVSKCDEPSLLCFALPGTPNDTDAGKSKVIAIVLGTVLSAFVIAAVAILVRCWRKRQSNGPNEFIMLNESNELIGEISSIIFSEWKDTFRAIEPSLGEAFIESISRHVSERNQKKAKHQAASQCLRQWMKENPEKDSFAAVLDALVNGVQNNNLAERLRKRFPKRFSMTQNTGFV